MSELVLERTAAEDVETERQVDSDIAACAGCMFAGERACAAAIQKTMSNEAQVSPAVPVEEIKPIDAAFCARGAGYCIQSDGRRECDAAGSCQHPPPPPEDKSNRSLEPVASAA